MYISLALALALSRSRSRSLFLSLSLSLSLCRLQIKVRYVAIEDDFLPNQQSDTFVVVDNTGAGGMSLTCEPRASTWVFEGKVWNMKPKEVEAEAGEVLRVINV
jgi:hypothetical protein